MRIVHSELKSASVNFALLFIDSDGPTSYFPQVFDSQLFRIIKRMPACVVAVCKHLRL